MIMNKKFDFQPTSRVVFGANSIQNIKEYISAFDCKNLLIVTDHGIVNAGILDKILHSLKNTEFNIHIFKEIESNPTTEHVNNGVAFAGDKSIDLIVGLGGGSAMDCAKGINFLLSNGGKMEDYWGINKARKKMLTSIGIPTTAGTGREGQSYALILQKLTHKKMACGDIKARFALVILDPELLNTVPHHTAVATGIDAISHTIESYVSTAANAISQMFARTAWKLLEENFDKVLDGSADLNTWGNMQLGAHFAGQAIENSMLGAAHAMANPIMAKINIDHGIAVGLVLPHVIDFNSQNFSDIYFGFHSDSTPGGNGQLTPAELIKHIDKYFEMADMSKGLRQYGIAESDLEDLASGAMENWTSKFNPRPLNKQDYLTLYKNAF